MRRLLGVISVVLMSLLSYMQAQQNLPSGSGPANQLGDRSAYLGRPVTHPEVLSGVWETSNGHGGAVGIHLMLTTTVPGDAKTLNGTQQLWQSLEVGVYERKRATIQFGEEGNFSDSPRGGNVSFEAGRLQLHFLSPWADTPSVDLDLVHDASDRWTGRLHSGAFDSSVTLIRPSAAGVTGTNPIAGTWRESSGVGYSCVHIAQQTQTEFTGWSDALQDPGHIHYANNARPAAILQHYGDLMKVHLEDDGKVSFELHAFTGMCCSHMFVGTLTQDGNLIQGTWPAGMNQAPHAASWVKMSSDSCVSSDLAP